MRMGAVVVVDVADAQKSKATTSDTATAAAAGGGGGGVAGAPKPAIASRDSAQSVRPRIVSWNAMTNDGASRCCSNSTLVHPATVADDGSAMY